MVRICSLFPSATEIAFALGLGDVLVGVSHACDYPPEARRLPVLTESLRGRLPRTGEVAVHETSSPASGHAASYAIREDLLRSLRPDLVLTQDICDVCAIGSSSVFEACSRVLGYTPQFVTIRSRGLEDILQSVLEIGAVAGVGQRAESLVVELRGRIEAVRSKAVSSAARPRVLCLEWARPAIAAGLWIPEMVNVAGGAHGMSAAGERARRVSVDEISDYRPEALLFMPCGWDLDQARQEFAWLRGRPEWERLLPVLSAGGAYIFDGRVPSRHGPRTADVLEAFAEILHAGIFPARWRGILYEAAT
ncbi:MAG: ABC transporter substrate-binding protein [Chloroflexi bacterium]|nr:ABC transporter substrate-binding protein [Chloroflexota bacterium]